jgi:hypothetical protein
MASNEKPQVDNVSLGKNPALRSRTVLTSIVSGVELTKDQQAQIKAATGIDVEWLLFHHSAGSLARNIDPSALSVTRVTYCW